MNIMFEVVHKINGRARVKIKSSIEPSIFFMIIESVLPEMIKIKRAEINIYAKSVTIYFKNDSDLAEILKEFQNLITISLSDPVLKERLEEMKFKNLNTGNVILRDKVADVSNGLNNAVKNLTGNITDMRMSLTSAAFLTGLGILIFAPEIATPAWLVLLIFSATSFNQTNNSNNAS